MTGDPIFSDRAESPVQLGLVPIYQQEGAAFGEALVASGETYKVAGSIQNDDYGKGYWQGFLDAIEGADQITVVKELTYEPGPAGDTPTTSSRRSPSSPRRAPTSSSTRCRSFPVRSRPCRRRRIGWMPIWFLPSNTASARRRPRRPAGVTGDTFPGVYAVGSPRRRQPRRSPSPKRARRTSRRSTSTHRARPGRQGLPALHLVVDRRADPRGGLQEHGGAHARGVLRGADVDLGLRRRSSRSARSTRPRRPARRSRPCRCRSSTARATPTWTSSE